MSQTIFDELLLAFVLGLVAIPMLAMRRPRGGRPDATGARLASTHVRAALLWAAFAFGALGAGALVGERKGVAVAAVGVVFATLGMVALLADERPAAPGQKAPPG